MVRRLLRYTARYWRLHALVLLLSLCAAGISVLQPWLWKLFIDEVLSNRETSRLPIVLAAYAASHVAALLVEIGRHYFSVKAGNLSVVDRRNRIVQHLRELPLRFFYRERTGRIMSVITDDAPAMEGLFRSIMPRAILHVTYLIAMATIILSSGHPALIVTALLSIPFYIIVPVKVSMSFRKGVSPCAGGQGRDLCESPGEHRQHERSAGLWQS